MKRINLPISLTITLLLAALLAIFAVFSILMNSILSDSYTAQGRNITFIENTRFLFARCMILSISRSPFT